MEYISPNILSAEILFSRKIMLRDGSQMPPNVLKAILDYRDFLSSFSTAIAYMQTLQPLVTSLAILMSSILPFLFPVRKTSCIAPILLVHKANLFFKSNHYYILFFPLKFPELRFMEYLMGRLFTISALLNVLKYSLVL